MKPAPSPSHSPARIRPLARAIIGTAFVCSAIVAFAPLAFASPHSDYYVPRNVWENSGPSLVESGTTVSVSGDGTFTVFESTAKLTPDAEGDDRHVYRKNTVTGAVDLVSTRARDSTHTGSSFSASISGDGRFVTFMTTDRDVFATDPGPTEGAQIAYRDMNETVARLVTSRHAPEVETLAAPSNVEPGENASPVITADGRHVAFVSTVPGVNNRGADFTGAPTIEIYDAESGDVTSVHEGRQPSISADGRYIAFTSGSGTATAESGKTGVPGSDKPKPSQVFRYDRVAATAALVSNAAGAATPADGDSSRPSISADGSRVAFMSGAFDLVESGDIPKTSQMLDAYVRDLTSGHTHRVSLLLDDSASPSDDEIAAKAQSTHRTRQWKEAFGGSIAASIAGNGASVVVTSINPLLSITGDCSGCQTFADDNDALDVYSVGLSPEGRPQSVQPVSMRKNLDDFSTDGLGVAYALHSDTGAGDSIADGTTPVTADGQTVVFGSIADDLRGWDSTRKVLAGDLDFNPAPKPRWKDDVAAAGAMWVPHYLDGGFPGSTPTTVRLFKTDINSFASHLHPGAAATESLAARQTEPVDYNTRTKPLPSLKEKPSLLSTAGRFSTESVRAGTSGTTYQLTVTAHTSGSAVVELDVDHLSIDAVPSIPSGWARANDDVAGTLTFTNAHVSAGDVAEFALTTTEVDTGAPTKARVTAEANGATGFTNLIVRPSAPVCAGITDQPPVVIAGLVTALRGVQCLSESATISAVAPHGVVSATASGVLTYTPDSSYRGHETLEVTAADAAGRASLPTFIAVTVGSPALALDDAYAARAGEDFVVDAAHGLLSNDIFPTKNSEWHLDEGNPPDHGTVKIDDRTGSFVYSPPPGFTGDAIFRYRAYGPDAHSESNIGTVTIHVQ
ncbi:TolB family protein [Subtercola frigoramans]|uniref:Uncharacterized protein n=1 Tax=Subtercola frigoramans TaxID=120298 RepID=A0ABS2L861_9MICO|nr:Ig-like domain-containing protein [Subtercola frigoramans]MBM7473214.1 hypothetical protein [Subtercola frigoramans]